ncbi:hypothetical protein L2E82_28278 [Cichorium intybus]|uniref:Uncharacterized protein n=1 Tax=Cichorium intybus TaxID=13427 RepID=A0ACB9CVE2_CICIN|nr:hypothetical protein L2E82_28278 [Cichorium intybus]
MGRAPCCDKSKVKKGPWSPEEDTKLKDYIHKNGTGGNWIALPHKAGLKRCGKSCRLRWLNYLRPDIKHGEFSDHEDRLICTLFSSIGSRWSVIAAQLPGRTDNDIKNYWNTKLKKKLMNFISTNRQIGKPLRHLDQSVNCTSSNWSYPTSSSAITVDNHPVLPSDDHGYINVDPMETYQVKDDSTLMFEGGDQAAGCTSNSDWRYHHVYGGGVFDAHNNMGVLKTGDSYKRDDGNCEKASGYYGDSTLEFGLEEFKKLISTNLCSGNTNNNLNVFVDELKAEENIMYY